VGAGRRQVGHAVGQVATFAEHRRELRQVKILAGLGHDDGHVAQAQRRIPAREVPDLRRNHLQLAAQGRTGQDAQAGVGIDGRGAWRWYPAVHDVVLQTAEQCRWVTLVSKTSVDRGAFGRGKQTQILPPGPGPAP